MNFEQNTFAGLDIDYNVNAIIFIEARIMTTTTRTVEIFPTERSNVLNMVWSRKVDSTDVAFTFRAVTELLDKSTDAVHIIVDIRQDPKFPLQTTISETLSGPFRHAKMGQWLVLGTSRSAKLIANVLTHLTNRQNILWFNDEASLQAYIAALD